MQQHNNIDNVRDFEQELDHGLCLDDRVNAIGEQERWDILEDMCRDVTSL